MLEVKDRVATFRRWYRKQYGLILYRLPSGKYQARKYNPTRKRS